jgi:cholesterol transport system auxiliary component
MLAMTRKSSAWILAIAAPVLLGGCVSVGVGGSGSEAPVSLLNLTPDALAPAGSEARGKASAAILILEPEAPAKIDVLRVPVQVNATEVAYLKQASWVEKPTRLFRRLLAETVRVRTGRVVYDGAIAPIGVEERLGGTLREFGYDAASGSVLVRYDAVRSGKDGEVETRRFEVRESGILAEPSQVGEALNRAANKVASEVTDWVSRT